jgi:hypothetical protein
MILATIKDMLPFFFVVVVMLISFTLTFTYLHHHSSVITLSQAASEFVDVYHAMFGDFEPL